jgi:hypothetical protein
MSEPRQRPPWYAPGTTTLALLSLVWLLATLSSARQILGDSPDPTALTITRAALELPRVVSASLVAGAAVGLAAVSLLSRASRAVLIRPLVRLAAGTAAGSLLGLGVAVPVAAGYAQVPGIRSLSAAIGAAAALGGLLAGVRHRAVIAAGVAASLGVFAVTTIGGAFDGSLRTLVGAGQTPESILAASGWVVLSIALVAGGVAGLLAYLVLRRAGATTGPARPAWPAYLVAGALPGLLALAAEVVTRLGGSPLVPLISPDDRVVRDFLTTSRVNQALVVLFTGAVVSLVLHGRTLGRDQPAGSGRDGESTVGRAGSSAAVGTRRAGAGQPDRSG